MRTVHRGAFSNLARPVVAVVQTVDYLFCNQPKSFANDQYD